LLEGEPLFWGEELVESQEFKQKGSFEILWARLRKRFKDPVAEYSATVGIQQLKMEKSLDFHVESFMKFKRKLKLNDITLIA
jgi:hypothetical protein